MRKHLPWLLLCAVFLSGCYGLAFSQLDGKGWDEPTPEEKADAKFWDNLYGRQTAEEKADDKFWDGFYGRKSQSAE